VFPFPVPAEIHFHVFFSAHRFFCGLIVFALSYPACKLSTLTSSPWSKSIFILPALVVRFACPLCLGVDSSCSCSEQARRPVFYCRPYQISDQICGAAVLGLVISVLRQPILYCESSVSPFMSGAWIFPGPFSLPRCRVRSSSISLVSARQVPLLIFPAANRTERGAGA
jgi:hypothetical protein